MAGAKVEVVDFDNYSLVLELLQEVVVQGWMPLSDQDWMPWIGKQKIVAKLGFELKFGLHRIV